MSKPIGIFVAWPYANGRLHLGHIAGAYLPADIFARFNRLSGNRVLMVSGSDTHGTPITLKAREEKCTPYDVVARYHATFLQGWKNLGITFDLFTHTHTDNHISVVQDFFSTLHQQDDLEVHSSEQFYDIEAGMFLPDRYVIGECPKCGNQRARGDQCEACGTTFETAELINPRSLISDSTPELRETEHFFFRMDKYEAALREFVEKQDHWRPHVKNYTMAALRDGLKSRPITRDIDWGVPVPVAGWEDKVIYVWFDAVIGYYSAALEWAEMEEGRSSAPWWTESAGRGYYFIGKDNVPFHSVIWPIELLAYGHGLQLPYDVPANQFLNIDGEKFSTSRGLAVWLDDVLEQFDPDAVRYYLASIFPETKDSNFTWKGFVQRNNGELVAAWGNLVNRVLGFAVSRFDSQVPEPGTLGERDEALLNDIQAAFTRVTTEYELVNLREALRVAFEAVREVNRYLDDKAPWHEFKIDPKTASTTIYCALHAIDTLKMALAPVLPFSSQKIHEYLGYSGSLWGEQEIVNREAVVPYDVLVYRPKEDESAGRSVWQVSDLKPGQTLLKPAPLFKLIDEEAVLAQAGE